MLNQVITLHYEARIKRVKLIIAKLAKKLKRELSADELLKQHKGHSIGRPHIASYLTENDLVKDPKEAFNLYLGSGKLGDIKNHWQDMETIINTIKNSGGIATLAHPAKYNMTRTKLLSLVDDFKHLGGEAIEVISGKQSRDTTTSLAQLATAKKLYASCGSDFHEPGKCWTELGQALTLPKECRAIWDFFS